MKLFTLFSYLAILAEATTTAKLCPPLGAILPPVPGPLSTNEDIQQVSKNLSSTFNKILDFDNVTSLAVQMTSLTDSEPLFEFFRAAPKVNRTGAHRVTAQTQFRLASVTKVFTVLAMLQHEDRFDWRTPISHYVPELLSNNSSTNDVESVRWDQVTLDALASQLGGIPRDIQDLALLYNLPWAQFGFPTLNSSDMPPYGVASHLQSCDAAEYINALRVRHPAYAPYDSPVYSNAAYALLGFALERILGQDYTNIIQRNIFDRLGMMDSSIDVPSPEQVLIPPGDSQGDLEDGLLRPTGQLYSSIADLSTFALSVLNSTLLSRTQTNRWLKPRSHTSSLGASVGAPWEICRTDALTLDGRVIDLYSKNGGLGQYGSYLVLVPDYNVAVTVLMAGPSMPLNEVTEAVLESMIPAIDAAARNHAAKKYVGTYTADNSSSNMSIILTDAGLNVTEWFNDGKDILATYASASQPIEVVIYPSGLRSSSTSDHKFQPYKESWRGVYHYTQYSYNDLLGQCTPWLGIDGNVYGQRVLDEFVFGMDTEGNVASVQNSALRKVLHKQ